MENTRVNALEKQILIDRNEGHQARLNRLFVQAEGREDPSRREACVKHFDLGNHRHQAILYACPVHFQNADGAWEEIDNTLEEAITEQGRPVLRNRANRVRMEFPQEADGGSMASITEDGRTFSWRFEQPVQAVAAQRRSGFELRQARLVQQAQKLPQYVGRTLESLQAANLAAELESQQDRRAEIVNLSAENRYDNILPGVSVRYALSGEALKEDIILSNADALSRAALRLPDEYNYTLTSAQEVQVLDKDSGECLFIMGAPLAYDAEGSNVEVQPQLTPCNGYTRLAYQIDEGVLGGAAYPLTIDPVVKSAKSQANISDAALYRTEAPNTPHYNKTQYDCGNRGANEYITLIRFGKLVKQRASDTIINATIRMIASASQDVEEYMACYPIKKAWSASTATWNSMKPDTTEFISDEVISYVSSTGGSCDFDITNLYRSWYHQKNGASQNFGVAFRYPLGVDGEKRYVGWVGAALNASTAPCMFINYISHAGLQSWWTYESMSAGRAGTAYVDLFNGNLVYEHVDTSMSGSRVPISVTHYYNSCLSDSNAAYCGYGWRTTAHQTLHKVSVTGPSSTVQYYVWTDGDGTEHYFPTTGSAPYKDEEGMGLKLTVSGSEALIQDKSNMGMRFPLPTNETRKNITRLSDACGNAANYSYGTDGKLTKVTDGAGRATQFSYNASGLLEKIQAPDGSWTSFTYNDQRLTQIRYSDLTSTQYTSFSYETGSEVGAKYMLTAAQNYDGLKLSMTFEAAGSYDAACIDNYAAQARRVRSLEVSNGTVKGAKQIFEYLSMMTRVKAVEGSSDSVGKTITYQFNDAGNMVCMFDELGYAKFSKFDSTLPNAETESSRMQKAIVNLARGLNFAQTPACWSYVKGNAADSLTRDTSARCLNVPSLKVVKGDSGEALARQTAQIAQAGAHTFSAYVKVDSISGGAFLRIKQGSTTANSPSIRASTANASCGPGAEGWDRVSVTATLTAGSATLELVCNAGSGTVYFACPQLETGEFANRANLLSNGNFALTETNTANASATRLFPVDWTAGAGITTNTNNCVRTSGHGMPGCLTGNALQMISFPARNNVAFTQQIPVSGAKNDVYVIGGWVNSRSVGSGGVRSAPCIAYRFTGGSNNGEWKYAEFSREWVGWQFGCWAVAAPAAYTGFDFSINYARNAQTAMFTNMFMHREQFGQTFAYDEDKNLLSVANLAGQKSDMKYDSYDNLTSYVQPGAAETEKYSFTYGSTAEEKKKHLLRSSITPMGVKQEFTYDAYGNPALNKTVDGTTAVIGTKTEYSGANLSSGVNYNYPHKTYDARGNAVTRQMNAQTYTLSTVTDPNGQSVNYQYDAARRVTGVQTQAAGKTYRNAYTYNKDRIQTVAHNTTDNSTCDVVYRFDYDALGRKTSVKVGNASGQSQTLSTNVYSTDRSGLLTQVQYGNGGKVKYSYDDFDRLTGIAYDAETTPRYAYTYDATGQVAKVRDTHLNRTLETQQDLAMRPRQNTLRDANGNVLYRTTLYYDKRNRLEKFAETAGSQAHTSAYAYDKDNRVTSISYDGGTNKIAYTYDKLGRIQKRTATQGSNSYDTAYSFAAGDTARYGTGATTPLVSAITQPGMNLSYAYDNRGNISSETRGGKTTTYAYDALGQLTRVNDPHENATWVYQYDRGGNILRKIKYAYTTGTLGHPASAMVYNYGDSNWKDKLTAYRGESITYDAIGNPLDDGERQYSWAGGRQLQKIVIPVRSHLEANAGTDSTGSTVLNIERSGLKLKARVFRGDRDATAETNAGRYVWYKRANANASWAQAASGARELNITQAEMDACYRYRCVYTDEAVRYGTVNVTPSTMMASHTPGTTDAGDVFALANGKLSVTSNSSAAAGYRLENGVLKIDGATNEQIEATANFVRCTTAKTISFAYDHNGLRTQKKIVEGGTTTTYDYTLHGKLITHLTKGTKNTNGVTTTEELHFFYDVQSRPAKVEFNGTVYTYLHNLQGDIVGIIDSSGSIVVEYKYDAWGKPLSATGTLADTLGKCNPFRYRGYVFDEETGLYYVRTRYYDATLARFLNVDGFDILAATIGQFFGSNQFQYCRNACPIAADEDGKWLNIVIGAAIGAVISAGTQIVSNITQNRSITDGLLTATVSGAITGGVAASGVGVIGQVVVGAAVGAGAEFTQQMIDSGGDVDPLSCFIDCAIAAALGAISGGLGGKGLVNCEGPVFKQGTQLLNVMRNVERGLYSSTSKALSRLSKVGTDYLKTYMRETITTAAKYSVLTVLSAVAKPKAQQVAKDKLKIDVASSVASIA